MKTVVKEKSYQIINKILEDIDHIKSEEVTLSSGLTSLSFYLQDKVMFSLKKATFLIGKKFNVFSGRQAGYILILIGSPTNENYQIYPYAGLEYPFAVSGSVDTEIESKLQNIWTKLKLETDDVNKLLGDDFFK